MAHLDLQRGTYAAAETLLGSRSSRKVGHNTYMRRVDADTIAVRYHSTDVYTLRRDGWAILNSGGWQTVTTSSRINALLPGPWGLSWSGGLRYGGRSITPYADGLAINTLSGAVGFATPAGRHTGPVGVLLTAEEVADLVTAANAREEARAEKRRARIIAQHPAPRAVTARPDMLHSRSYGATQSPMPSPHRGYRAAYECESCKAEQAEWAAIRRATLEQDHEAGHAWTVTFPNGSGTADCTMSEPAGACPFDCPRRGPVQGANGRWDFPR